jgi:AcrR family transcriptional regulator
VSPKQQAASVLSAEGSAELSAEGAADDRADGSPEVELLISATWAVAARTGSIEPGVREILQEAGLSTKAFYRHFRSKDELLLVALDRASNVLVEYLDHRMDRAPDPLAKIVEWIDGCLRQAVNPSAARRILPWTLGFGRIAAIFPEQLERNQDAIIALLEREIRAAVESGEGRSPDPAGDAQIIFAYTAHTVHHHLINGTAPDAGTTLELAAFAQRALGAPADVAPEGRPAFRA